MTDAAGTLARHLCEPQRIAVAVSGGVDSMTLAVLAHRVRGADTQMFHAVSPAVPPEATDRVRRYACSEGWALRIVDAGEFGDPNYLQNPVNRCFACKTHLYQAITERTNATVVSGTNADDLGDFRPGLVAAKAFSVRHPYVEVGLGKSSVRALADALGLEGIAELPAAPCLASRVETGITIDPATLVAVNKVERALTDLLQPQAVRCRVRSTGVVIELDADTLQTLSATRTQQAIQTARRLWPDQHARVSIEPYIRGSAFVQTTLGEFGREPS